MDKEWSTTWKRNWTLDEPEGVTCECGERTGFPISNDWWRKHTRPLHKFKYWIKRRFKK